MSRFRKTAHLRYFAKHSLPCSSKGWSFVRPDDTVSRSSFAESATALIACFGGTPHSATEEFLISILSQFAGFLEADFVIWTSHPKIGEMVKKSTKYCLAVLGVLLRIKDVKVPKLIDVAKRHSRGIEIETAENQEVQIGRNRPNTAWQSSAYFCVSRM